MFVDKRKVIRKVVTKQHLNLVCEVDVDWGETMLLGLKDNFVEGASTKPSRFGDPR